ncbi:MAG: efflux RND transporter periplasmic adaptor subunit [Parabacteroides gordonii]|uniref:efflux RND transporter periplasmic adaptor subunit n=1 Tax=Parabacteroides gordonii TaxID=574930 RepID=UPI003A894F07
MKKRLYPVSIVLLLFCTACNDNSTQERNEPIPVKIVEADMLQRQETHSYVGVVESNYSSSLSFQVAGQVASVYVNKGQQIKKGDLLAELNADNLKSSHEAAQATLNQAEDAYKRLNQLYENNSLPEIKFVEVQTKLEQARSMERIAAKNLQECKLYAPFSGIIGDRTVDPGENVLPGVSVMTLLNMENIKLKISVPESEVSHISKGQKATVRVATLNNLSFTAVVMEKSMIANPISHTYEVKCKPSEEASPLLLPGMVCSVDVFSAIDRSILVVPADAVQTAYEGGRFVWTTENGQAFKCPVQTGELTANGIVIRSGIKEGAQVIVEGWHKISEGTKVTVR